jgi:hypothetical protein
LAHLGFHRLQELGAADADFHLVLFQAGDDASAPISTPGQRRATSALQYFIASACCASAPGAFEVRAKIESVAAMAD